MSGDRPLQGFGAKLRDARERRGISLRQIANATMMWQLGFWDQQQALSDIDPEAGAPATPRAAPPVVPKPGGEMVTPSEGYSG